MSRPWILLAEGHRDCRDSLALALEMSGFDVLAVANGHEAIVQLRRCTPAAVVLDSHLTQVSALHVGRVIRANPRFDLTPLMLTSTWFSAEERARARVAGFDAVWMKPFDFDQLIRVVRPNVRLPKAQP
jgi:two-component system response regulator MprA